MSKIVMLNTETGEILQHITEDNYIGSKTYDELKQSIVVEKQYQKTSGQNFVFTLFNSTRKYLEKEQLPQTDITRLIVLSTYIGYDGRLMSSQKKAMTKKDIKITIKLNNNNNAFKKFFEKSIDLGIIIEKNKEYFLSEDYFCKGQLGKLKKDIMAVRLYCNTIQYIFENIKNTEVKRIGYLFQLLPYVHYDYNVLCFNPNDRCDGNEVLPLRLGDIQELLGINKDTVTNMAKLFSGLKLKNGTPLIARIRLENDNRMDKLVLNPDVMYRGKLSGDKMQAVKSLFV